MSALALDRPLSLCLMEFPRVELIVPCVPIAQKTSLWLFGVNEHDPGTLTSYADWVNVIGDIGLCLR